MGPWAADGGGWKLETCRKRTGNVLERFENPLGGTMGHGAAIPYPRDHQSWKRSKKRFVMEAGNAKKTFPHEGV